MKRFTFALAMVSLGLALATGRTAKADPELTIKIATLAPAGSSWAKILEAWGVDVETATKGKIAVKFFETGEQGDERDVVRKMKLGQIDGSAITAVGLGLIKSDVRVLELPFLFKNDGEVDFIRDKMSDDFVKQFDEAGYVLVAWGDVGWVHLYSNIPIKTRADLDNTKMWAWTDDPIVRAFFKRLGVNGVPLGVPDVQTALATGTINACYGSPLAVVALKWYPNVKFATTTPISYSIGAMVLRKEVWNKLDKATQQILMDAAKKMGGDLKAGVRKDNERAKKAMTKFGVQIVEVPAELQADFEKQGAGVWDDLKGNVYSAALLDKVKKYLGEFRAGKK